MYVYRYIYIVYTSKLLQCKFIIVFRSLETYLLQFIERIRRRPEWLLAVPLIHFISGASVPFKELSEKCKHNAENTNFWGTELFKDNEQFKSSWES